MARLSRVRDGAGDEGSCVIAWKYDPEGKKERENVGNEPIVGCCLEVGSVTARSMQWQDFWLTTEITEILEKKDGYVKFKTGNSEYEFWQ